MHSPLDTEKRIIRMNLLRQRHALTPLEIEDKSRIIENKLFSLAEFQSVKNIMFYVSLPGEVDTHKMISKCLDIGNRVFIPITDQMHRTLVLSEIHDFPVELTPSTYGVLEPKPTYYRYIDNAEVGLIIMPGVAFDKSGHRLGHGGGYYDKFLKTLPQRPLRIALAFDFQILDNIPREIWDMPVDMILTESEIINCRK